ncbi:MAG: serpin family protein [Xanthomonadales bacterium]|nr:serpin family protein [Xanthomonadales bacterium]
MKTAVARWLLCTALLVAGSGSVRANSENGMNGFACSLYGALAGQQENLFFSPFSVGTALAMTAEGARGETARQLAAVLGLNAPADNGDPLQPVDFSPLHAELGRLAERLAPKPAPAQRQAQLAAWRLELDRANAALARATDFDAAYYALGEKAQQLAADINRVQREIDPTEFRSANALWLERSFAIEPPYLAAIARYYQTGGAMPVDFRGDAETARRSINDWVAAQTNQRIRELLARGMVDAATRLVLTNAVYFLGEWLEPFDAARTRNEKFFLRDGGSVEVPMMRDWKYDGAKYAAFQADGSPFTTPLQIEFGDRDHSRHYPQDGFQLVELPYRGDALSMQLILPMRADGLAAVEALLDNVHLERWNAALVAREVDVALPKFRMDSSLELSAALQQLGLRRAFVNPADTAGGAQFDGISVSADPAERLYIGAVVHKAFVAVDEKGTEAAAATAVIMPAGAAMPDMVDFTPVFRADRAFIFLIRDRNSGTVLFLGRLQRP